MSKRPLNESELNRIRQLAKAQTLYEVLGVPMHATRENIESNYRNYVREWHPDRFFSRDCGDLLGQIENNFVEATRAFETLRDDRRRKEYDGELIATGQHTPEAPVSDYEVTMPGRASAKAAPKAPSVLPRLPLEAIERLKAQVREQQTKALEYLAQAKEDIAAERYVKAEGTLYLALKIAPKNKEIMELHQKALVKARQIRALGFLTQAENAEQYGRQKEALQFFEKAVECDPADGKAFFQLARIRKALGEHDQPRELLQLYRKAALRSPDIFDYRMALAETYFAMDMTANAHREAQAAMELNPKSDVARALHKKTRPW
jgi:curved DNA-binding protein CbpA